MESSDQKLLRAFVETGADAPFTELTRRHIDLVHGVAARVTGDPDLARDVTQTVFTDLARKAAHLRSDVVLPAWLYRAATFAASKIRRQERRRLFRETEAMRQHHLSAGDNVSDDDLLPFLDEALGRLPEEDRQALILRYLSRQDFRSVGLALGVQEDAARKRVERAVERLRGVLEAQGCSVPASTLVLGLGILGSQTAPAALAGTIAAGSLAAATPTAVTFLLSLPFNGMIGILGLALAGWVSHQDTELRALRANLAALDTIQSGPTLVRNAPAALSVPESSEVELGRLRDRATALRRQLATILPAPTVSATAPVQLIPGVAVRLADLLEAGSATPEAALQSSFAAFQRGDLSSFLALTLSEEDALKREQVDDPERVLAQLKANAAESEQRGDTLQLLQVVPDGPERATLQIRIHRPGREDEFQTIVMGRSTAGWRYLPISVSRPGN